MDGLLSDNDSIDTERPNDNDSDDSDRNSNDSNDPDSDKYKVTDDNDIAMDKPNKNDSNPDGWKNNDDPLEAVEAPSIVNDMIEIDATDSSTLIPDESMPDLETGRPNEDTDRDQVSVVTESPNIQLDMNIDSMNAESENGKGDDYNSQDNESTTENDEKITNSANTEDENNNSGLGYPSEDGEDNTESPNNQTDQEDAGNSDENSDLAPKDNNEEKQKNIHEFDCKEISSVQLDSSEEQIPLECVIRGRDKEKTIYFVIDEEQINGDISRLFDDNVKVVIKDLMVMDISPK